jgi:hypothetical protein
MPRIEQSLPDDVIRVDIENKIAVDPEDLFRVNRAFRGRDHNQFFAFVYHDTWFIS